MTIAKINTEEGYKFLINLFFNSGYSTTDSCHLYSLEVRRYNIYYKYYTMNWLIKPSEYRDKVYDDKYSFKNWRYCIEYHNIIAIIKKDTNNFNIIAGNYIAHFNNTHEYYLKSITNNHQTDCLEIFSTD